MKKILEKPIKMHDEFSKDLQYLADIYEESLPIFTSLIVNVLIVGIFILMINRTNDEFIRIIFIFLLVFHMFLWVCWMLSHVFGVEKDG